MLMSVNQSLAVLDNDQPYSDSDTIQRFIDSVSAKASTLTNQSRADDVRLADVINSTKGEFLHFNLSKTNSIFRLMFISVTNVLVKFCFYIILFVFLSECCCRSVAFHSRSVQPIKSVS